MLVQKRNIEGVVVEEWEEGLRHGFHRVRALGGEVMRERSFRWAITMEELTNSAAPRTSMYNSTPDAST